MTANSAFRDSSLTTIAILDADVALRSQMVKLFSSSSCEVEEFNSAEQLLQSPNLKDMNCLIISIQPTFSATKKLIKAIRRQNSSVSIIAIGNYEGIAQAVTSIRAGADDYIYKPINTGKIRTLVQQLLTK